MAPLSHLWQRGGRAYTAGENAALQLCRQTEDEFDESPGKVQATHI